MAIFGRHFSSFDEVAMCYENTTPIRLNKKDRIDENTKHPMRKWLQGWDIRPTNCRARKWERVIKINANKYALCCSTWLASTEDVSKETFLRWIEKYSNIVWRRDKQGNEFIDVRNATDLSANQSFAFNGVYNFIYHHLPYCMSFRISNGKQYVDDKYLPKRKYLSAKDKKTLTDTQRGWNRTYYSRGTTRGDYVLTFQHTVENGTDRYSLVSREFPETVNRIDIKTKKRYATKIEEFRENTLPLAMVFRNTKEQHDYGDDGYKFGEMLLDRVSGLEEHARNNTFYSPDRKTLIGGTLNSLTLGYNQHVAIRQFRAQLNAEIVKQMDEDAPFNYVLKQMFFNTVAVSDRALDVMWSQRTRERNIGALFNDFINHLLQLHMKVEAYK